MAWKRTSPSQIKTVRRCARRWWWQKIKGLPDPAGRAAQEGQRIHKVTEDALGKGKPTTDACALALMEEAGVLGHRFDPADLELKFTAQPTGYPVNVAGVIDLVERDANRITDWKTTSNLRYAPSDDELPYNVQAVLYSDVAVTHLGFTLPVSFRLIYATREARPKTRTVEHTFNRAELDRGLDLFRADVDQQVQLAQINDARAIPHNPDACNDYGKRCPFFRRCLTAGMQINGPRFGQPTTTAKDTPMNPLLALLNKTKPATQPEPSTSAFLAGLNSTKTAQAEPPVVEPPVVEPAQAEPPAHGWQVGHLVQLGDSITAIKALVGDDAAELDTGVVAYLTELVRPGEDAPSPPSTMHDPLRDGINPPDGVPADEVVPVVVKTRAMRLPSNCPAQPGELVSTLRKADAIEARAWLLTAVGEPEPYGKGITSAANAKADVLALCVQLAQRGPAVPPSDTAPTNNATAPTVEVGASEPAPGDTPHPVAEGAACTLTERPPMTAVSPGVAALTKYDPTKGARAVNAAVTDWINARTLVLVGCVPSESVPFTPLAQLVEPLEREVCAENGGAPYVGLVKDYQISGYCMAAAKLRMGLETDAITLPPLVVCDLSMPGARDYLGVLARFCAMVMRP
jgi:hypothetical protein